MVHVVGSIIKKGIELRAKLPARKKKLHPMKAQMKVLKMLLQKGRNTAFGEYYDFDGILQSEDIVSAFKRQVPIFDYTKMHNLWWYRTLSGESYVSWPGKVKYFALSSGTSEASSKYIPVTPEMLRAIKRTSIRQIMTLVYYDLPKEFYEKGILMLGGSTHLSYNGTYYEGDLSGITTRNLPFWFMHHYKPGKRISRERDWTTKLNEIVEKAPSWDIGAIVGVPAWLQILLQKIIERYKLKHIHELWPNLLVFCHGGVSFTPYQKSFEKLLGKPLIYIETYLASEGFIAYQNRPETKGMMQMVVDNGLFYEFVPFNKDNFDEEGNIREDATTLTIDQVENNVDYALLLSTVAGAWRYLIGDVIRFIDKDDLQLVIVGRTKHYLSVCGEHLSIENMNRAIELLEKEYGVHVPEFTVAAIPYENMFAHKWWLGASENIDVQVASKKIDEYLKVLNDDYRTERLHAIKEVIVEVLPTSAFYDFLKLKGKEGGQHKFPRVMRGKLLDEWEQFIKKYS